MGQKKKNNKKSANNNKTQQIEPVKYEVTVGTPARSGQDYDRQLREQAGKEAEEAMKVAFIQLMNEENPTYPRVNSNQSPITGDDAIKLKWKWASGLDWNPSNVLLSNWLRVLAVGDYEGMMAEIEKTSETELLNLLERRETIYNFSALFHVVKGASMTLDEEGRTYNTKCKFVDRSKQPKHLQCAVKLIELGANVNAKDMLGATPLFFCVMKSSNPVTIKIAKVLLDNGAEVNATNRLGETALLQPVMMKRFNCVDFLMKNGADPSIRDNEGGCCSDMAIMDSEIKEHLTTSNNTPSDCLLICALCSQPSKSRCTACFVVRYCSKECQLVHWDKHKKPCKVTKKKFTPVQLDTPAGLEHDTADRIPKDNFVAKIKILSDEECNEVEGAAQRMVLHEKSSGLIGVIAPSSASYVAASAKLKSVDPKTGSAVLEGYFDAVVDKDLNVRVNFTEFVTGVDW